MAVANSAVGQLAPEFTLKSQTGESVSLSSLLAQGPALVVFYPGDFTPVCTKQLCNYRDNLMSFIDFGVQIVGISRNSPSEHAHFAEEYGFSFPLLSDPGQKVARE